MVLLNMLSGCAFKKKKKTISNKINAKKKKTRQCKSPPLSK